MDGWVPVDSPAHCILEADFPVTSSSPVLDYSKRREHPLDKQHPLLSGSLPGDQRGLIPVQENYAWEATLALKLLEFLNLGIHKQTPSPSLLWIEIMMDVESAYTEFIACDRTGRRNAVPDITGECTTGVKDLSENMGDLNIQGSGSQEGATSSDDGREQNTEAQEGSSPS